MSDALESKLQDMIPDLQEMIDKQRIQEVLLRYARGIDRRDWDLIMAAFHDDASVGASNAKDLADYMMKLPPDDPCYVHYVPNILIELDGDKAYAETYFISIWDFELDGKPVTRFRGGRYLDRFERRDGVWKIAHRDSADDWDRLDEVKQRPRGLGTHAHEVKVDPAHRGRTKPDDIVYHMREEKFGVVPIAHDHSWSPK